MLVPRTALVTTIAKAMVDDPVGTSYLLDEVVANWMMDEIESRPDLSDQVAKSSLYRLAVAKRALGRAYVESVVSGHYPGDEFLVSAQQLVGMEGIAKAKRKGRPWTDEQKASARARIMFNPDGTLAGSRKAVQREAKTTVSQLPYAQVSPHLANYVEHGENGRTLMAGEALVDSPEGRSQRNLIDRHQGQWEQASQAAKDFHDDWGPDNEGVNLQFTMVNYGTGDLRRLTVPLKDVGGGLKDIPGLKPMDERISDVELVATDPKQAGRVAAFHDAEFARGMPGFSLFRGLMGMPQGDFTTAFGARDYNDPDDTGWKRLRAGSSVLRALPGGGKAADWAKFVGEMGPEADKVLGPHVRRAAYRYRGTERTPDPKLREEFASAEYHEMLRLAERNSEPVEVREAAAAMLRNPADDNRRRGDIIGRDTGKRPERQFYSPSSGAFIHAAGQGRTGDSLRLNVASDVAASQLINTLPEDPLTAKLSERSGHVLPSQGVIINPNGELTSQAVGYADDHYLPFDFKNLAGLRGGQYVRTRVLGGLSGEDIYTSVAGGARMATVVSGSGVFSVEFDPTFRGARANNDKARSMYMRYLKILDAVDHSGLYALDLKPEQKASVRARAKLLVGPNSDKKVLDTKVEQLMDQEREAASELNEDDLARIKTEAQEQVASDPRFKAMSTQEQARQYEDVYNEKLDSAKAQRVQPLKLNSAGYEAALKTLQAQFPYYIRNVSYSPLRAAKTEKAPGFLESRGLNPVGGLRQRSRSEDTGFVAAGGLRPRTARSGFYETGITGPLPAKERFVNGERATAAAPTGPGAAAGGTGQGTAGAAAPTGPAAPAAPGALTPLQALLAAQSGKVQASSRLALNSLSDALSGSLGPTRNPLVVADKPPAEQWAALPEGSRARWLLEMMSQVPGDQLITLPGASDVLQNRKAVEGALRAMYPGMADAISTDFNHEAYGGATDSAGVISYIATQAQHVADAKDMGDPFVASSGDPATDAFHKGTKPIAFNTPPVEIGSIVNHQMLNAFGQGPVGSALNEAIVRQGWDVNGSRDEVARDAKEKTRLLEALPATVAAWRETLASTNGNPVGAQVVREILEQSGEPDKLAAALGPKRLTTDQLTRSPDQIAVDAGLELQQAWSLLTAERALAATLPEAAGGGVVPKVRLLGAPVAPAPVEGPVSASAPRGLLSPRVRLVSKSHPAALRVGLRRRAGLPLL